jgi:ADP-ribose pyrophosphatase YjhB (NUDIX family)
VPWRPCAGGVEVVLVRHRATGRWELPKGKPEAGEAPWSTARRELSEETGLACRLGEELARVELLDRGRWRTVRYWLAEPLDADGVPHPRPGAEIAEARWCRLAAGEPVICQPYDGLVLVSFASALARRGLPLPVPPVPEGPGWRLVPRLGGRAGWPVAVSTSGAVVARLRAPVGAGPAWHAGGTDAAVPPSSVAGGPDAMSDSRPEEEVRR